MPPTSLDPDRPLAPHAISRSRERRVQSQSHKPWHKLLGATWSLGIEPPRAHGQACIATHSSIADSTYTSHIACTNCCFGTHLLRVASLELQLRAVQRPLARGRTTPVRAEPLSVPSAISTMRAGHPDSVGVMHCCLHHETYALQSCARAPCEYADSSTTTRPYCRLLSPAWSPQLTVVPAACMRCC